MVKIKSNDRQTIKKQHTAMGHTGKTGAPRPQRRTGKRIARKDTPGERTLDQREENQARQKRIYHLPR